MKEFIIFLFALQIVALFAGLPLLVHYLATGYPEPHPLQVLIIPASLLFVVLAVLAVALVFQVVSQELWM